MTKTRRPMPHARWALQDAKNRLSEVVDAAIRGEAQVVTRRGVEAAVIISHEEYTRMTAHEGARQPFTDYLLDGPTVDDGDAFERIELRPRSRRNGT